MSKKLREKFKKETGMTLPDLRGMPSVQSYVQTLEQRLEAGQHETIVIPTIERVREWHKAFNVPIASNCNIEDDGLNKLRIDLIEEELDELKEALENRDIVEVLDALADLQYVLDGTFLSFGYWQLKHTAVDEVHRSNMSKLGEDGKPIYREDGKVLKGPNFQPPKLSELLV